MPHKNDKIAHCGLDCSFYEVYKAAQSRDSAKIAEVAEMFSSGEEKYSSGDVACDGCHGSVIFS